MKIMKRIMNNPLINILILLGFSTPFFAQQKQANAYNLSLKEAVTLAKENNKTVQVSAIEQRATQADYNDAKNTMLPTLGIGGTYQRFSKATLYDHGFNESTQVSRQPGPDGANLGVDLAFNIYSGGKTKSVIEESSYRNALAAINSKDQGGNIALQTAAQYLDLIRLYHFRQLIKDQEKRAEARLKNITSFYKNQRVTKSDLLRAELTLSNVLLNKTQNENDIEIGNKKLGILVNVADRQQFYLTDTLLTTRLKEIVFSEKSSDVNNSYQLQKADMNLKIQSSRIKNLQSNYYPSLSLISAYGFNYPNYLFFKPIDQAYSAGFVGVKMNYSISSLYQNKNKVKAAKQRLDAIELQKDWIKDNVQDDITALNIKYGEALNRIEVTDKSIEQARVNFEIINTKYLNQLSLLTDLLDADNLYQESRYTFVNAQITALIIYYKLQYTTGNL
ncbi:TolC family protein [Flavobacterium pectinovorum]|uniref:TolC family protein n=2 Tax=Flavobacterium pectinovorum TaxID=29533 RepID=A0A502EL05_9FLAO|nr:TolC family protein [Flavobacterium pectinovorum]